MQLQSMHVLFGWRERSSSKSNRRVSAAIIVFVLPSDPSVLYDRLIGLFRTHSFTRFVTGELTPESNQGHFDGGEGGRGSQWFHFWANHASNFTNMCDSVSLTLKLFSRVMWQKFTKLAWHLCKRMENAIQVSYFHVTVMVISRSQYSVHIIICIINVHFFLTGMFLVGVP